MVEFVHDPLLDPPARHLALCIQGDIRVHHPDNPEHAPTHVVRHGEGAVRQPQDGLWGAPRLDDAGDRGHHALRLQQRFSDVERSDVDLCQQRLHRGGHGPPEQVHEGRELHRVAPSCHVLGQHHRRAVHLPRRAAHGRDAAVARRPDKHAAHRLVLRYDLRAHRRLLYLPAVPLPEGHLRHLGPHVPKLRQGLHHRNGNHGLRGQLRRGVPDRVHSRLGRLCAVRMSSAWEGGVRGTRPAHPFEVGPQGTPDERPDSRCSPRCRFRSGGQPAEE
mmetsp:Transcript_24861/g.56524  ORF Transcript_24861/g.56524 Transcript_24861/m.56524 type:complete len:275 (-) Transcript_24861:492-1316(-)